MSSQASFQELGFHLGFDGMGNTNVSSQSSQPSSQIINLLIHSNSQVFATNRREVV